MKLENLRIAITSSAGDMVASAIIALRRNNHVIFDIHAFNSEASSVCQLLADRFDVVPRGDSPDYVSQLINHVKRHDIEVLMPWSDEEAFALSYAHNEFLEIGCKVLTSPSNVIQTITNKALTYDKLRNSGLAVPQYAVVNTKEELLYALRNFGYPSNTVVVKPCEGRGGRGVKVFIGDDNPPDWIGGGRREQRVSHLKEEDFFFELGTCYIVMPCLQAPVYDVDVFRLKGNVTRSFTRERTNPCGIPFEGNTLRKDDVIAEYAINIADVLDLQSLHDIDMMTDRDNRPVLLEVNPRPSGSLASLNSAGYPLLDHALAAAGGINLELKTVKHDLEIIAYKESITIS